MLHYFKVEELSDQIRVAGRLANDLRGVRDQTTQKLNNFLRRTLDREIGIVEYFDTPDLGLAPYNIWLRKKNVDNVSIALSYGRDWDNYPFDDPTRIVLDAERGKLTLYGPFRRWPRSLRVTYDGGYPALADDEEVMDCPQGLKFAAIQQGVFDARRSMGMDQGTSTDDDKKTPIRLTYGLLPETAAAFIDLRRPLGN